MTQPGHRPSREKPLALFGRVFLAVLLLYVVAYLLIEHRRIRQGPWQVTFGPGSNNVPAIRIHQPRLGITNFEVAFPGAPADGQGPRTLRFDQARPVPFEVPYGRCVFLDTTFLPGTVTLQLLGAEIELLPRVLVLNHAGVPWTTNSPVVVPVR